MMQKTSVANSSGDSINLLALFEEFAAKKWFIILSAVAAASVACTLAFFLPKKYTAEIVISPVSQTSRSSSGLGGLTSQLGGLASLAGISVNGSDDRAVFLAVLQSDLLTERYIQEQTLLSVLFSSKWDAKRGQWIVPLADQPTLWQANQYFKKKVRGVEQSTKTGLVTLSITWSDPNIAAKWANDLVAMANSYLQEKAITEAQNHIAYLSDQAHRSDITEIRAAAYSAMESEIKSAMLAKGTSEYAFKVIDPATVPEKPSSPKPTLWTVLGFVLGGMISVFAVLVQIAFRSPAI